MHKAFVLIAALALAVTGCSKIPDAGVVVQHGHRAAWTQMVCSMYNQQGMCQVWMPVTYPERWSLLVDPDTSRDGDETWVYFRQNVHEAYPVGSIWRNPNPEG